MDERGKLVGALEVYDEDEVLVIMESGNIVRSAVNEIPRTGRTTQGVTFARPAEGDRIIAVARNLESDLENDDESVDSNDEGAATDADDSATDTPQADDQENDE